MSILSIVGIVAGIALALVVACVILAAMFPPKEYKGELTDAGRSGNDDIGSNEVHT